jgi:hypothetical protein
MRTEMRKWLEQQSKDFYAASFDALVKRWEKFISVGGGYVEKYMFFRGLNITCFHVLYHFVAYLVTLIRTRFY